MDPILTTTQLIGGSSDALGAANTLNLDNERLDCEHLDNLTQRIIDPNRPSFVTVLMRFFANIFVDCFRAVFS